MPLPPVSREQLIEALRAFDRDKRAQSDWAGWEDRKQFKYAIRFDGQRYPVKEVVSLATGLPPSHFYGGDEANDYVRQRGFDVEALRSLQSDFEAILKD